MSIGLIILLALAAWALGPLILRCAGGLLTSFALVLWAIPMQTRTSTAALAFTGITGAAMWHSGASWRARRDAARITGGTRSDTAQTDRSRHRAAAPREKHTRRPLARR